jgi:plasmid stabilization system protein ParE
MAYHVEVTDRALRDLALIYKRIEAGASEQAAHWFDGLEDAIFSLADNPTRAPVTPENSALRHLLYGKKPYIYRVIYKIEQDSSTVRVVHIRPPGRDRMKQSQD